MLLLGRLGNQNGTQVNTKSSGGSSVIRVACLIGITKSGDGKGTFVVLETMVNKTLEIS